MGVQSSPAGPASGAYDCGRRDSQSGMKSSDRCQFGLCSVKSDFGESDLGEARDVDFTRGER